MKIRTILSVITGLILGLDLLAAQETAPMEALQVAAQTQVEHPFIDTWFYPSWSKMTAEAAKTDVQRAMEMARERMEAVCAVEPGCETWENVFQALDRCDREVDNVLTCLINLFQVANTHELKEVQQEMLSTLVAFRLEMTGNQRLWQVIKRAAAQPWVQELPAERKYFVERLVATFRESGADLPDDKRAHLRECMSEMIRLQLEFDQNGEASAYRWGMDIKDPAKLDGVPRAWMKENSSGRLWNRRWLVTLADAEMILGTCTVASTRKACWEGWNTLGNIEGHDNAPVVGRIMELRQEIAETAGFANYADLMSPGRMADSGQKAMDFVDDMMNRLLPAFQREQQEILDLASEATGGKVERLNPWDYKFYSAQLAKKNSDFDEELIRPYLRSDNVFKGMFGVFSRLYDISITELPTACIAPGETCPEGKVEVWAGDVRVFKVTDNKTGRHLGSFYWDVNARYGKQGGGWTMAMRPGIGDEPQLAVLICSFPCPDKRGYTLMTMQNVRTLFHEFGHMLHAMFCRPEHLFFSMQNLKADFAELPSQFHERYAFEPEVLATYAFHHETGEPMPAELVQMLQQHHEFHPATETMEILRRSKVDLELHMHYAEKFAGKSLDEASAEVVAPWAPPLTQQGCSEMRYFAHCISKGYAAAYYSYAWSEVLAADVFARFKQEGLFNTDLADAFRRTVLQPGAGKPAAEIYRDFMGRDPKPDALMEKYGDTNK